MKFRIVASDERTVTVYRIPEHTLKCEAEAILLADKQFAAAGMFDRLGGRGEYRVMILDMRKMPHSAVITSSSNSAQ